MKLLRAVLPFVLAIAAGQGAVVKVNSTTAFQGGSPVPTLSTPALATTTGNLIYVGTHWCSATCNGSTSPGNVTCTDTALNTYTQVAIANPSFNSFNAAAVLVAKNITGNATNVVTCAYVGNAEFLTVNVIQYSGADVTNPTDTGSINNTNSGATTSSSFTSGMFSTVSASETLVAFAHNSGGLGITFTAGTGYTLQVNGQLAAIQDELVTVTQSNVTSSISANVSGNWAMIVVGLVATAPAVITADNANLVYSGRWNITGSGAASRAITINAGSRIETSVQNTQTIQINFDVSALNASGFPDILYRVDGGNPTRATLGATGTITVTFPIASLAIHWLEVWAEGVSEGSNPSFNQWTSLAGSVNFQSLFLDSGGSTLPIATSPNIIEFLGDSITATVRQLNNCGGGSNSNATCMAGDNGWAALAAKYLAMRPFIVGFGGQGVTATGSGGVPIANTSFPLVYAGASWSPTLKPTAVVVATGTNDGGASSGAFQAAYTTYLNTIRAAYPVAVIFCLGQPTNTHASDVSAVVTALADPRIFYLNYTGLTIPTTDGTHPNTAGATLLGANVAKDVQAQLTSLGIKMQSSSGGGSSTHISGFAQ